MKSFAITFRDSEEDPSRRTVELSGFLDADTVQQFSREIDEHLDENVRFLVILMEQLSYVSSAGIGALMGLTMRLRSRGGELALVRPTEKVYKILDLLGLTKVLRIADSEDEALQPGV